MKNFFVVFLQRVWGEFLEYMYASYGFILSFFLVIRVGGWLSPRVDQGINWTILYIAFGVYTVFVLLHPSILPALTNQLVGNIQRYNIRARINSKYRVVAYGAFLLLQYSFMLCKKFLYSLEWPFVQFWKRLRVNNTIVQVICKLVSIAIIGILAYVAHIPFLESCVIIYAAFSLLFFFSYKHPALVSLVLLGFLPFFGRVQKNDLSMQIATLAYYFLIIALVNKIRALRDQEKKLS